MVNLNSFKKKQLELTKMNYTFMIYLILLVNLNQGKLYYKLEKEKFQMKSDPKYLISDETSYGADKYKDCLHDCDKINVCKVITFNNGNCQKYKGGAWAQSTEDVHTEFYVQKIPSKLCFKSHSL